jgi:hypothetical protein
MLAGVETRQRPQAAAALVEDDDIGAFDLEGNAAGGDPRPPYLERFIHGAIYEARPEIQAVEHAHAEAVLPFTISTTPLRPVVHLASFIGPRIPVWDIRDNVGDTDLLVTNTAQGRDLARCLGAARVAPDARAWLRRDRPLAAGGRPRLGLPAVNARVLRRRYVWARSGHCRRARSKRTRP